MVYSPRRTRGARREFRGRRARVALLRDRFTSSHEACSSWFTPLSQSRITIRALSQIGHFAPRLSELDVCICRNYKMKT